MQEVVEVCKKYFPASTAAFGHSKVTLRVGDGFACVQEFAQMPDSEKFDVILTDSSDPVGPGVCLFEKEYYLLLEWALRPPYGIMSCLGFCFYYNLLIYYISIFYIFLSHLLFI